MHLAADVIGSAPIDRVDILYGQELIRTVRPCENSDLGRRVRVMWSGAEYRGRGREVNWRGKISVAGNRVTRAQAVNFLNPDRPFSFDIGAGIVTFESVTTGNMAGVDLWLEQPQAGTLSVETNIVSANCDLAALNGEEMVTEGGGLARKLRIYRLPEDNNPLSMRITHDVTDAGTRPGDVPVYIRVTQQDGHQAWSSPIYLVKAL